jgi:hypothetical protein
MSIECALLGAQITHHDNNIMCQCGRSDAGPLSIVGIPFQLLRQARGDNSCACNVEKQRKSTSRRAKTSCMVTWRCWKMFEHAPTVRTYASTLVSKENPAKRRLRKRNRRKHVQTCSCTHSVAKVLTSYRRRQNGHCS